jgi:hypothetical protein
MDNTPSPDRTLRVMQIIHLVFTGTIALYAAVAALAPVSPTESSGGSWIAGAAFAAALCLVVVAPQVRRRLASSVLRRRQGPEAIRAAFLGSRIVELVLYECAAGVGLVLTLVRGDPIWCYSLSLIALLCTVRQYPTRYDVDVPRAR